MQIDEAQLIDFLLKSGAISRNDLVAVQERAASMHEPIYRALVSTGVLSSDEVRRVIARMTGVPFVKLSAENLSPEVFTLIPEPLARTHRVMAYRTHDHTLEVALLDLDDYPALSFLESDWRVAPRLTEEEGMKAALLRYQKYLKQTTGDALGKAAHGVSVSSPNTFHDGLQTLQHQQAADLVDKLLNHALMSHATDVHLEPKEQGLLVRYRIAGRLYDGMLLPPSSAASIQVRLKFLAQLPLSETSPQEGRFRVEKEEGHILVTLVSAPSRLGERITLHLTPEHTNRAGFTLETLGLYGQSLENVYRTLAERSGLIVVSGPSGAGKTTFLYTLLDLLASPDKHVITVEEQVKYPLRHITQTQAQPHLGLSLVGALRGALKQDPDVLMLSTLDDAAVAAVALAAANRGTLVLAGIKAPSVAEGITKLQRRVPSLSVASTLNLAVGVSHVRRLCDKKDTYTVSRSDLQLIEKMADSGRVLAALKEGGAIALHTPWKDMHFHRSVSCEACDGGYKGRIGVQEVWPVSRTMKELIVKESDTEALERVAQDEGISTLVENGIYKAAQGYTTLEEVARIAAVSQ